MRCLLLLAVSLHAFASGPEYDPADVIQRAKDKILESTRSIPRYTCVETVSRDYFVPVAPGLPRSCSILLDQLQHPTPDMILRPYSQDRLRLEVTMGTGKEIFSWAGAKHFDDAGIDHLIRSGPMSSGNFGGYLQTVFGTDVKKFHFEGMIGVDQRSLMQYSFHVPQAESHYRMRLPDAWENVAYSGTLAIDPATADLVRMKITTGEAPAATGLCQAATAMEFAWVRLGDGRFLLPSRSHQHFVYPNVSETDNTLDFSDCREFHSESTLRFGGEEPEISAGSTSAPPRTLDLPLWHRFSMALTAGINTGAAAAGDPFYAILMDPLRDRQGKVVAPKGTAVEGHILRVQSYVQPAEVIVVLRPEALVLRGVRTPFSARRDISAPQDKAAAKKKVEIAMPLPHENFAGAFRFSGEHVTVPAGFRSNWKIVYGSGE